MMRKGQNQFRASYSQEWRVEGLVDEREWEQTDAERIIVLALEMIAVACKACSGTEFSVSRPDRIGVVDGGQSPKDLRISGSQYCRFTCRDIKNFHTYGLMDDGLLAIITCLNLCSLQIYSASVTPI